MVFGLIFGLASLVLSWNQRPPRNPNDICAMFQERRAWHASAERSFEQWGVPESLQMAVIFHESSFRARARPPRRKILWIFPGPRPTSAYGYAQVLDSTWQEFRRQTGRSKAERFHFDDVAWFIGWYGGEIQRLTGIAKDDAYRYYLAYHEGPAGFNRRTYDHKPWLLGVAREVEARARTYQRQYDACQQDLRPSRWRRWRWLALALALGLITWILTRAYRGMGRTRRRSGKSRRKKRGGAGRASR